MKRLFNLEFRGGRSRLTDGNKARSQAVTGEQSSRKNIFLPFLGKDGICFNQSNNRRLALIPSLKRVGDNIVSRFTFYPPLKSKAAFTLAEVLITLGIIGVVASLTMPTMQQSYQKRVAVVRLQKFYSIMSQAVTKWENDNGYLPEDVNTGFGALDHNANMFMQWWIQNLGKEVKTVSSYKNGNDVCYGLADGSGFCVIVNRTAMHFVFCPEAKGCSDKYEEINTVVDGKNSFLFSIEGGKFITSYKGFHSYTRDELLEACKTSLYKHACTRLIEVDGWQIKDDYPWR